MRVTHLRSKQLIFVWSSFKSIVGTQPHQQRRGLKAPLIKKHLIRNFLTDKTIYGKSYSLWRIWRIRKIRKIRKKRLCLLCLETGLLFTHTTGKARVITATKRKSNPRKHAANINGRTEMSVTFWIVWGSCTLALIWANLKTKEENGKQD